MIACRHCAAVLALLGMIAIETAAPARAGIDLDSDPFLDTQTEYFDDPFQQLNVAIYFGNRAIDMAIVRPISAVYRSIAPPALRRGISNVIANLQLPVDIANNALQLDFEAAAQSTLRFAVNTTVGIGGVVDIATPLGLPRAPADFGLTLAHYGVGEGPYLVLPFLGPSSLRDLAGILVDRLAITGSFYYPLETTPAQWTTFAATSIVDARARNFNNVDEVLYHSADGYSSIRTAYFQNRRRLASNGAQFEDAFPDLLEDALEAE